MYRDSVFLMRARTGLASDIAGIERQKINDAGHHGFMPCLPETKAGSARQFSVSDLVALRIYANLLKATVSSAMSGLVACRALELLKEDLHNDKPTLFWAVIYPYHPDTVGDVKVARNLLFHCNQEFKPKSATIFSGEKPAFSHLCGEGFYIDFRDQLAFVTKKLSSASYVLGDE